MALSKQLQDRIEAVAADLRKELYGPKGYPPWGTKFVEIEEQTGEVGDALACVMLSQGLREQVEADGHMAGKCSGCGEPIPLVRNKPAAYGRATLGAKPFRRSLK